MDPLKQKLQQRTEETAELEQHQQQAQKQNSRQFADVEGLIQFDAAQVTVPPSLKERLKESIAAEKAERPGWLRRFLGQ